MPDTVTRYGQHKFGSKQARPKIVEIYRGVGGWQPSAGHERLTRQVAEWLRVDGVTMVRVRWRFRIHEVMVRKYLEF